MIGLLVFECPLVSEYLVAGLDSANTILALGILSIMPEVFVYIPNIDKDI